MGILDVLAFMGYYEDDDVSTSLATESLNVNEEEKEEDRTTIQIVGLGLGRTGTTSLAMALEILGYAVVHDDEQVELTDLYSAMERDEIDIDEFHNILGLRGYNATFKTADYEWVEEHPEVKAILTVRDTPDKYVDSWLAAAPFIDIIQKRPYCWMGTVQEIFPSLINEYKIETTGGNPEDFLNRATLRESYIDYIEEVQDEVPEERLLTFNVKQGWEPLCKFLNKPVPEGIPFPHVHTRAKLDGEMRLLELVTFIWPLAFLVPMLVLASILKRNVDKKRHSSINNGMLILSFCMVPLLAY